MTTKENQNPFAKFKSAENNWFLSPQQSIATSNFATVPQRLNGFDSKILEEKIYLDAQDTSLKLEYRIEEKEKVLNDLKNKIRAAEAVGNQQELFTLRVKKQRIDNELRALYKEYSSQGLSSKISGSINSIASDTKRRKMPIINSIKRFLKRHILARVSRKFSSIVSIGDSLETLDAINRNVDELLKMKTPYGETAQNYQKLTEYLYRAHKIRSQINNSIKK